MFSYVHNEGILVQCGYYKFNYAHNASLFVDVCITRTLSSFILTFTLITMIKIYQQTQGIMQYPHFL
jgi:hypothetical protein